MSQHTRKTLPARDVSKAPKTPVQASGDTNCEKTSSPTFPKSHIKIPKKLRYDLDNALIGLCDVWFEEIKPYLVRNNIKLHVHEAAAGGGGGDREALPPGAPGCSHLDPASSAGECELCRLLFNAANSIDSAVSQAAGASAHCSSLEGASAGKYMTNTGSPCRRSKKENGGKPRRRSRQTPSVQPKLLVPRLCRTYSILPCQAILKPKSPSSPMKTEKRPRKTDLKNASTQTLNPVKKVKTSISPQFCHRPATRTFVTSKAKGATEPLFQDDLIDIISEKHDKRLKVLFRSPREKEIPSTMNLFSPSDTRRKPKIPQKITPWK